MESERMCIACRKHKNKKELTRVVRSNSGTVEIDLSGKKSGRGAYICSKECMQKCKKSRLLNKAFKCEIDMSIYDTLIEYFEG